VLDDNAGVLLGLFAAQSVHVWGCAQAHVLVGSVVVAEFVARSGATVALTAPTCAPPLEIASVASVEDDASMVMSHAHAALADDGKTLVDLFSRRLGRNGSVLLLQRMKAPSHAGSPLWWSPGANASWASGVPAALGQFALVRFGAASSLPDAWLPLFQWLEETARGGEHVTVIVAGRVGSGKSTLCRMLANRLLNSCSAVRWLDADPGQAEFLPPGVIGLNEVEQPVFGESVSQARLVHFPHAYFVGESDAGRDPIALQVQIGALFMAHASRPAASLVVNTPGWITGIGRDLLRYILDAVPPSGRVCFVELSAADVTDVQQAPLTELVADKPAVTAFSLPSVAAEAQAASDGLQALQAAERREMRLFHHLTGSLAPEAWHAVPMRRVAFERVRISALDVVPHEVLYALNGAVVGLCADAATYERAPSDYPLQLLPSAPLLAQCLSLGVVRGIDAARRELFVYTSLSDEALQRVNTIVLGHISLPATYVSAVALVSGSSKALPPYVSFESLGAHEIGAATSGRRSVPRIQHQTAK
jgi:polynucleotide 5'-hydroxyl-kinase GRC3/NOL9